MTTPTDNRGGYRPPARPAPVSGPGKLSKRTDGQPTVDLPNPDYGEQQTFRADQQGAQMAQTPGPGAGGAGGNPVNPADLSHVVGLNQPTQNTNEPVTAGAASGPGPGPAALGLPQVDPADQAGIQYLRNSLPTLELMASMPMATSAFRQFVRRVRAQV